MSSAVTIGTLERISAAKLRDLVLAEKDKPADAAGLAVIDVRDDDYIGGHIRGAKNFPSQTLDATLPTLIRSLCDSPTVVFHCALSQQRGPGAALRYIRERERVLGLEKKKTGEEVGKAETEQKVYVLDRGFVGWQEEYGEDENLTEGYRKELWRDGYWG